MPAKLQASEVPVWRTGVGNSEANVRPKRGRLDELQAHVQPDQRQRELKSLRKQLAK